MFTINAEIRTEQGKSASRRLRLINKFPAIVYGGTEKPVAITLDQDDLMNQQAKPGFYEEVLNLVIDGKSVQVKIQAAQRHPFKPKFAHIDFVRV
ncbi:MAG: 50S ribosomal protein L25 [Enterobacteriaceae bacterium]|jgi:large subunit ribosomal protein L25|nr:50S ribosomal protein L25 [Enterobacteriaceae bacterium]